MSCVFEVEKIVGFVFVFFIFYMKYVNNFLCKFGGYRIDINYINFGIEGDFDFSWNFLLG